MATQAVIQPYYAGSLVDKSPMFWGGPEYPDVKETASQTYIVGDPLYFDSNGTIAIVTSSGTPANITSAIAGQAIKAATGTTGASVLFRAIRLDDIFYMNVSHETIGSAVGALTDMGDARSVGRSTTVNTTKWVVTKDATPEGGADADADVIIIGYPLRSPVGGVVNTITDVYALVTVHFVAYSLASDGNPNRRVLQFGG